MAAEPLFHYEIEESVDPFGLKVYTIKCFGKLVSETGDQLKEVVKPLIDKGGSAIVLDFANLSYVDSSGLGTLVGLKVSAVNKGLVKLEIENLTPRVLELLKITRLLDMFQKQPAL
jgi:anti-sigma B factor antagonist